jgi:hypothetical protein
MNMNDADIGQLIARKSETANVDYKEGFAWTKGNRDRKYELVRDLLAMANTKDGGRVIFGVRDGDFEFIGVADDVYGSIDPNNVVQVLHAYSSPKVACSVIKREIDGRKVVVLDVAEFADTPVICTDTIKAAGQSTILRKGAIYIRTSAAQTTDISSADEMRELLGRAMTRKGDELLRTIERLLTGKPIAPTPASRDLYDTEMAQAQQFFGDALGPDFRNHGYLEVVAFPTEHVATRLGSIATLRDLVQKAEVSLRGWNFPHTDRENSTAFAKGFQSHTRWERFIEAYRLYRSGLFAWKRAFWEDVMGHRTGEGKRVLSFISAIYSFTEFTLFLRRLFEDTAPEATIHVQVTLHGCKDRHLASFGETFLWPLYVAKDNVIPLELDITTTELRASADDIARRLAIDVFHVFNWMDVTDQVVMGWQKRLLEKRT